VKDWTASPVAVASVAESFDPDRLADLVSIERERPGFKALVLDRFESHFRASLEHLYQAALVQDREQTERIVHRLQGSAASFGATRLTALLRDLQAQLKDEPRFLVQEEMNRLRNAGAIAVACYSQWLNQ